MAYAHRGFRRTQELFERAQRVVPGGIYGHQTPRMLVEGAYPYFFERAAGEQRRDRAHEPPRLHAPGRPRRTGRLTRARNPSKRSAGDSVPHLRRRQGSFGRSRLSCAECRRRGVYFHPHRNWFLSAAHTEEDVCRTLEVTDEAFATVRREFPA